MDYEEAKHLDQATAVTVGELRPAIVRVLQEQFGEDVDADCADVIAVDIIRDVMNRREPEWEIGDLVRDAREVVWRRYTRNQWQKMGHSGVFSHDRPARPLVLIDSQWARKNEARQLRAMERARDDGAPI